MIFFYPLAAQKDYIELMYSLRSIEKYAEPTEVIIVGSQIPDWLTGVTWIKLEDIKGRPVLSVRRKIIAALEYAKQPIVMMNDDMFLLRPHTEFPYHRSGELKSIGESGALPLRQQLEKLHKPTHYYGHYPCVVDTDFASVTEIVDQDSIIKSAYCNLKEVSSQPVPDCKLMNDSPRVFVESFMVNKPCISTGVKSLKCVLPVLEGMFSEPSKYEV